MNKARFGAKSEKLEYVTAEHLQLLTSKEVVPPEVTPPVTKSHAYTRRAVSAKADAVYSRIKLCKEICDRQFEACGERPQLACVTAAALKLATSMIDGPTPSPATDTKRDYDPK